MQVIKWSAGIAQSSSTSPPPSAIGDTRFVFGCLGLGETRREKCYDERPMLDMSNSILSPIFIDQSINALHLTIFFLSRLPCTLPAHPAPKYIHPLPQTKQIARPFFSYYPRPAPWTAARRRWSAGTRSLASWLQLQSEGKSTQRLTTRRSWAHRRGWTARACWFWVVDVGCRCQSVIRYNLMSCKISSHPHVVLEQRGGRAVRPLAQRLD